MEGKKLFDIKAGNFVSSPTHLTLCMQEIVRFD